MCIYICMCRSLLLVILFLFIFYISSLWHLRVVIVESLVYMVVPVVVHYIDPLLVPTIGKHCSVRLFNIYKVCLMLLIRAYRLHLPYNIGIRWLWLEMSWSLWCTLSRVLTLMIVSVWTHFIALYPKVSVVVWGGGR